MDPLFSKIDDSVNFITPCEDGGFFESRYVRRVPEYFICYLSSHSGCNQGCKFCHLTTTNQKMMTPATFGDLYNQRRAVIDHYKTQAPVKRAHFNFMARGEALLNPEIQDNWPELSEMFTLHKVPCRTNISTIMPKTLKRSLTEIFRYNYPVLYYSLYSMDEEFRSKWLPGAMPAEDALFLLKEYQRVSGTIIKLHWALIEGENDDIGTITRILKALQQHQLVVELNLVRYNPPDGKSEECVSYDGFCREWQRIAQSIGFSAPFKVIPRVGLDVMASCGTFYSPEI